MCTFFGCPQATTNPVRLEAAGNAAPATAQAMKRTLRPYRTAGVALVGAGLIAVTPVGPSAVDVQMRAVRLAGADAALAVAPDYPIYTFQDLVTQTTANLAGLQAEYAANPTPVLTQAMANWSVDGQDFATALQTADSNFTTALADLPTVLQNASTDLSQGDVFDAITSVTQYVQSTTFGVVQPVFQTAVQVAQEMSTNVDNVVQNAVARVALEAAQDAVARQAGYGPWLTMLANAPEYAPNAAITAAAGVSQDIATAVSNGDYTTAWDDLMNAGPTILYGYLDGYPLNTAIAAPDLARIIAGIPSEYGLLTNETVDGLRGFFENHLDARLAIASDIAPAVAKTRSLLPPVTAAVDAHMASLDSLLTTVGTDLSTTLNTVWADLGTMFDPGAATDISAQLGTELGELGTNLNALFAGLWAF